MYMYMGLIMGNVHVHVYVFVGVYYKGSIWLMYILGV